MGITNTTKKNIFLVFFGGVCYAHLLSFLWWCLLCSSFKFSLVVFVINNGHNKHHQRKLKRWA
jgi:hypothetical protein